MPTTSSHLISIADCTDVSPALVLPGASAIEAASPGPVTAGMSLGTTAVAGTNTVLTDSLYLTEAGDHTAISAGDINQGQLGDCFLLSSMGELAIYDPAAITKMISVNANGTESVALFESPSGQAPGFGATQFSQTSQSVTNVFSDAGVNNGATQDVVGGSKEIWSQVVEKAYAQANGGYAGIANGGSPVLALQQLTGHTAQWESPAAATAASLTADVNAGDLIVMDTQNASSLPYNLVGGHAYMFEGMVNSAGVSCVKLGNPWGFDQPSLIPVAQLSHSGVVEVDIGHTR